MLGVDASLRELNLKASELARRAQAGEVITITDRGRPIASLGPHRAGLRFARRSDVEHAFANLPTVDPDRFRRDLDEVLDPAFHDPDAL
jgi:antitoxin (DNA-binding transcriptional repressor) of toxin-antitoxin stability system